MQGDAVRRASAEFIGAFALTFIGAGAILSGADLVGVAFAYGLVVAVMVSALAQVSGGHFNPAITLGFLLTRRIELALAGVYWVAQLAGATIAALLLWWIYPSQIVDGAHLGAPLLNARIGSGAGFVVEVILTFFLVLAFFAVAVDPRGTFSGIAGVAVGLTITSDVLMGGRLTGAAMNPARAFGPMLVNNHWNDDWVWFVGPMVGGAVAALAYDRLYLRRGAAQAA